MLGWLLPQNQWKEHLPQHRALLRPASLNLEALQVDLEHLQDLVHLGHRHLADHRVHLHHNRAHLSLGLLHTRALQLQALSNLLQVPLVRAITKFNYIFQLSY